MSVKFDRRNRRDLKRVLVVDDEADIRELLDMTLARMGLAADCAASVAEAEDFLANRSSYALCLTDMRLPDGEGLSLVKTIAEHHPELPVAVITAHGSMENAVRALKLGAFDYLSKPVSLDQLRALIKAAIDLPVRDDVRGSGGPELVGDTALMSAVRGMIERVARSQAPVYVAGESGSGKELAARLIHQLGPRAKGPFVPVNCGAIPENLMESEFFGYRKGSFTGADADREGFFHAAHGGTLFLDEVADLPLAMQVKLLRVIQEKRVRKIGATAEEPVDVRIISATHQELKNMVADGKFRQDLFYRLNVIEIRMPPLRECREDIPMLAQRILDRLAAASGRSVPSLTHQAVEALKAYPFPGNVRELENVLERTLALLVGDVIDTDDLHLAPPTSGPEVVAETSGELPLQDRLDQAERQAIQAALEKTKFNQTAAARLLGVTFRSLRYRMERLGLKE